MRVWEASSRDCGPSLTLSVHLTLGSAREDIQLDRCPAHLGKVGQRPVLLLLGISTHMCVRVHVRHAVDMTMCWCMEGEGNVYAPRTSLSQSTFGHGACLHGAAYVLLGHMTDAQRGWVCTMGQLSLGLNVCDSGGWVGGEGRAYYGVEGCDTRGDLALWGGSEPVWLSGWLCACWGECAQSRGWKGCALSLSTASAWPREETGN